MSLDKLVAAVQKSSKYAQVTPELIRHLGAEELTKRKSTKEAIKATKNRLHQVAGAYFQSRPGYDDWLRRLREADDLPAVCRALMAAHVSTRERLPILDRFYPTIFADLPPVRSVMDVACGLNPLALPWMPLEDGATYYAYDIYTDMMKFLEEALPVFGVGGEAVATDVTTNIPNQAVDLALVIKAVPCLQHIDKHIGQKLLDGLNAPYVLLSFPAQSIGGHDKGMVAHYTEILESLVVGKPWSVRRYVFETELAFLVRR